MSCAEARPLLSLLLDGALDPAAESELAQHLAGCPACRELQRDLRDEQTLLRLRI